MKLGQRATYLVVRTGRALTGTGMSVIACVVVGSGVLPDVTRGEVTAVGVASCFLVALVVASAVAARLRFQSPSARAQRVSLLAHLAPVLADMEVGLALVAGALGIVAMTGGLGSPAHPMVYLIVAFSATFQGRSSVVMVVLATLALEATMALRMAPPGLGLLAENAAFVVLSMSLHAVFLRSLVAKQRSEHRQRLEQEVLAMKNEAREFRLIAATLGAESRAPRSREEEERRLAEGAVETIHASMYYTLELLKESLDLTTCVLLWLDDGGERLKIKELVTDADCVVETALPVGAGALGAIVKDRILLNLSSPKRGHVPYYAGPEEVGAFLGVPVIEDDHLRGVLCADRRGAQPFTAKDEALLVGAASQVLRAIHSERVFSAIERSKYEHERFYHASAMLGRALTPEQVMDTAIEAARAILSFDLASIALFDKEQKRHRVCRVRAFDDAGDMVDPEALEGLEFRDNAGLVSMVVKNKHYLPAGGELRDQSTPVYTRKVKLKGVESLLVLPLVCADDAIGTFTLAARRRHAFGTDAREMLGVIANQVAVSLANAKMYRQMEMMATTDGLTGLLNHRTFQERLADFLGRSERHGLRLALILTDIDHFKNVNDTYGHPVGDHVLKGVARVLQESVRKIDVVARYGGEEFAIIMEGADPVGAQQLAERIRQDVSKVVFQSDKGTFQVTLSLGVAGVPDDAKEKQHLIERADQALYHAKHNGRNRSVTFQQFQAERVSRKAS
ncbi:MAG: diguanylate cyclase [Deltaproteobacteria bacterium]|nr:diguanylate cyclase [Deltaproteobacteria bacterium]